MSTKHSNISPAAYPKTDYPENSAVTTLEYLLNDPLIKTNLARRDKRPNVDGDIELVDERSSPIGKLEVQVKHLSFKDRRRGAFSCKLPFLAYCSTALLPVLLIGVDPDAEVALWLEISWSLAGSLIKKALQRKAGNDEGSITVRFPKSNLIRKGTKSHIRAWHRIIDAHRRKLEFYDEFEPKAADLRAIAASIEHIGPGVPDPQRMDFTNIQINLDEVNYLFERIFPATRDALFRGAWKIGIAFSAYDEDFLSCCYYPIRRGVNDLLARRVSPETLKQARLDRTGYALENPIEIDPIGFAREYAQREVIDFISSKAFQFDDMILCRELLFSVADMLGVQLGLSRPNWNHMKSTLDINQLAYGWMTYLPQWVSCVADIIPAETLRNLRSTGAHGYVDLGTLKFSLSLTDKKPRDVQRAVRARIQDESPIAITFPVDVRELPLYQVRRVIDSLLKRGESKLERLYTPFDYSRLGTQGSRLSNCWTYDQCLRNVRLLYQELPRVFEHVVDENFPALKQELRFFDDFDRRVMVLQGDGPSGYGLSYCDLRTEASSRLNRIDVYSEEDGVSIPDVIQRSVVIDGICYEIVRMGDFNASFMFRSLPLLNEISSELQSRIDKLPILQRKERVPSTEAAIARGGMIAVRPRAVAGQNRRAATASQRTDAREKRSRRTRVTKDQRRRVHQGDPDRGQTS